MSQGTYGHATVTKTSEQKVKRGIVYDPQKIETQGRELRESRVETCAKSTRTPPIGRAYTGSESFFWQEALHFFRKDFYP